MNAGLDVLNISTDDFHQVSIPFDRVRTSYEAAKDLGLRTVVMTTIGKSSKIRLREVSRLLGDELPAPHDADPIFNSAIGVESAFTPVGRGASIPATEWIVDSEPLKGGCDSVLRDVGLRPGGEILPCCSAASTLPGFIIGSLENSSLVELISSAWDVELFRTLRERGPIALVDRPPSGYVNKCHLCHDLVKEALKDSGLVESKPL